MSETQGLLSKIGALRQRLGQALCLAGEARSAANGIVRALDEQVSAGGEHDALVEAALRPVTGPVAGSGPVPRQLTARARRVLERGRDLLGPLRGMADDFDLKEGVSAPARPPLGQLYREASAMLDTVLRTVALLPESTAAQLHLCEGLEATLGAVAGRVRTLLAGTARQRQESERIAHLAGLLTALAAGKPVELTPFRVLAEDVLAEARECVPLCFPQTEGGTLAERIACHGLTVARVVARVVRHDPELKPRKEDAVLAALLHDVGMLRVPEAILAQTSPLDDEQFRAIEAHARAGAELCAALMPDAPWLAEAACGHHERLNGTGYPDGLREHQVGPLARLLGVCDVYAAQCSGRPHRLARAPRTALTDTLLMAEQGLLDQHHAECLLHLSFYPVGSVVELAHGAVGVVIATPVSRGDLSSPARPVVALLLDQHGEPEARPHHLDLGQCENHSIVRSLSAAERGELLGRRFPEWAA